MIPLMRNAFLEEKQTCEKLANFIKSVPKLSMGDKVKEFEEKFAKYQGRKYCILVNSGASANFLLLQCLKNLGKIKEFDNIGFSSLTWATNVMPIIQHSCRPIPIDCSKDTLNVMSENLIKAIEEYKLDAFFSTNVLGFAGDLFKIKEICNDYGVLYIEDNCEALGTELRYKCFNPIKTGNFGLASTFSFFVAHHMSTIEGGAICTNDDELAQMLIMCRANGWDRNLSTIQQNNLREKYKITSEFQSKYTFYDIGMNVRPTEIVAFLGLEQLNYIQKSLETRQKNYIRLNNIVKNNSELCEIDTHNIAFNSNFSFPVLAKTKKLRDKYYEKFKDKVEIRPIICGNITKQPFWDKYIGKKYNLFDTDFIHNNGFYFGNYEELEERDLQILEELLK